MRIRCDLQPGNFRALNIDDHAVQALEQIANAGPGEAGLEITIDVRPIVKIDYVAEPRIRVRAVTGEGIVEIEIVKPPAS